MSEFICIRCRNVLQQKKPIMPDQACANGLKLHNIPQELENITPLECRLVAKCIPFLTILLMKRYGGHYKVNGPCVNVPTQLDQVLEILPRMPNELQLHPLKLKCKLEYKSHYMYNMIQKDTVIEAITWLKQHNPHYADIILNDDWYSSITNSELATLVHEHAIHQETNQSTVVNINTHTHDPHLDDTEQLHAQQSTDDILQVEGNKAVVMENNTNDDEETDSDLQEEQAALDRKQEMTGDALPSVVQIENLENRIYQCAPGENNIPKYILLDEDFEVLAFPDFFPYGEGGYYSERNTKLPI